MLAIFACYGRHPCSQLGKVQALARNQVAAHYDPCFNLLSRCAENLESDRPVRQIHRIPLPDRLRQVRERDRNLALRLRRLSCQRYGIEPLQMHRLCDELSHSELGTRQVLTDSKWAAAAES